MSKSFYPKMALSNINKNRRTYFPYIITCILTIMMYYMMDSIFRNENVRTMRGGSNVCTMLVIGLWVTMLFAIIFLFYTNSFLIKRRHKEIGLYNILGMEKRHIGKMMFYETLFTALISISVGILSGILFGKLMFLLLFKLIGADTVPKFEIPISSVIYTLLLSAGIFFAILLYNLAKIHLTKPIEMVHGGQIGEKEPKTKIILTIIGILTMGAGYGFALYEKSPLKALSLFLIAVILVIVGTYCLFTAGSIAFIKLLKKNKHFYYQPKHFTSVSGMLYRMKQNAVGLANICILSTMVLISVSTTVSLYLGMEDAVRTGCPNEMNISASLTTIDDIAKVDAAIDQVNAENNIDAQNRSNVSSVSLYCGNEKDSSNFELIADANMMGVYTEQLSACSIIGLEDFNKANNSDYTLNPGEVLVYDKNNYSKSDFNLKIGDNVTSYQVKEKLKKLNMASNTDELSTMFPCYVVVVNSMDEMQQIAMQSQELAKQDGKGLYAFDYEVHFDTSLPKQESTELNKKYDALAIDGINITSKNYYENREEFKQMYGGFLFVGMFVGSLFLMATVLIIYYKQISEGYEDQQRFEIMQKVGMSKSEVKKTIRSQVLTIFFIPLVVATLHVVVSFRIIKLILAMLSLGNTSLFIWCTGGTVLVFCLIYALVFAITEKSYYKIVSTSM